MNLGAREPLGSGLLILMTDSHCDSVCVFLWVHMYVWVPLLTCAVILNIPQGLSTLYVCLIVLFCEMESFTGLELT